MKRVYLRAYDKVNLGDDLFIRTIVKRYPKVRFFLRTDAVNRETFRELTNLKVLESSSSVGRFLGKFHPGLVSRYESRWENRCDAMVYIGGSIFMEYPTSPLFVDWLKYQGKRHPFYVLGANFGPYRTERYREELGKAFDSLQDVCFRDRYSCRMFPDCGNVRYAPDILLAYPMPEVSVTPKQVFVSVIDVQGREGCSGDYVSNMARILQDYLDDGCTLVLASFCREEGDEAGIRKILDQMRAQVDSRIRVLSYDGTNRQEMLEALASSDYVIASRFHGVILAMVAGRPVLPVIYSDKTLHVLEDLEFEGAYFDLRKDEPWDYLCSRSNWDRDQFRIPEEVRSDAAGHFEKLDQLLKR